MRCKIPIFFTVSVVGSVAARRVLHFKGNDGVVTVQIPSDSPGFTADLWNVHAEDVESIVIRTKDHNQFETTFWGRPVAFNHANLEPAGRLKFHNTRNGDQIKAKIGPMSVEDKKNELWQIIRSATMEEGTQSEVTKRGDVVEILQEREMLSLYLRKFVKLYKLSPTADFMESIKRPIQGLGSSVDCATEDASEENDTAGTSDDDNDDDSGNNKNNSNNEMVKASNFFLYVSDATTGLLGLLRVESSEEYVVEAVANGECSSIVGDLSSIEEEDLMSVYIMDGANVYRVPMPLTALVWEGTMAHSFSRPHAKYAPFGNSSLYGCEIPAAPSIVERMKSSILRNVYVPAEPANSSVKSIAE